MSSSMTAFVSLIVLFACGAANAVPAPAAPLPHADSVASAATHEKVNINSASVKELTALEGVGHKLAEKIVEYRDAHGPFKKAEDLRKVEGVGAMLWERNRERIVVK